MVAEEFLLTAISTVGFPIVAFFAMWKMSNDTIKSNTEAVAELKEAIAGLKH